MTEKTAPAAYELRHISTAAATGYFACVPVDDPGIDAGLILVKERPFDSFLRQHLIETLGRTGPEAIAGRIRAAAEYNDILLLSLFYEIVLATGRTDLEALFSGVDLGALSAQTPFIQIRSRLLPDQRLHRQWISLFCDNMMGHRLLPAPDQAGLPLLFDKTSVTPDRNRSRIQSLFQSAASSAKKSPDRSFEETIARAEDALAAIDVFDGPEMRHISSLSPIALLRAWRMRVHVRSGRNAYTLSGKQTSYGKGLSLDAARVSCLMEVVERVSSFASITDDRLPDYAGDHQLIHGGYEALVQNGYHLCDPNRLRLEVPYQDEPLYWIEAKEPGGSTVLVPAQAVFLFGNLDEINLFSGIGSTGLASGSSMTSAKLSALLEAVERDAEAVMPYHPGQCFVLDTVNPHLKPLFEAYKARGIHIQFQDLTTEFGIPCYKCFVIDGDGQVVKGAGANIDGRRAVMSALTETPYPFPAGPPSEEGLPDLPVVFFEDLPNYDTGDDAENLAMVETLLADNELVPLYVDLTRKDLAIPVVKALVPGLELVADFDSYSRVSPRLFANYCRLFS